MSIPPRAPATSHGYRRIFVLNALLRTTGAAALSLALALAVVPAAAADTDAGAQRLIVQVRDVGALDAVPGGVRSQRAVGLAGTHVLEVAPSRSDAVRAALARHPDVVYVEADAQVHAFGRTPNDPLWEDQWGASRVERPRHGRTGPAPRRRPWRSSIPA